MQKTTKKPQEVLQEYEEKSEQILINMFQVLSHSQRKVDDEAYRKTLKKLEKSL